MTRTPKLAVTPKKGGFTLIELLVVISIIGMLSSIVLASLNSARAKARDAQRLSDLRELQKALEFYYDDNRTYPPPDSGSEVVTSLTELVPNYIPVLPSDPTRTGVNGYRYYRSPSDVFTLLVQLESDSHTSWCGISANGGYTGWSQASWYRDVSDTVCR